MYYSSIMLQLAITLPYNRILHGYYFEDFNPSGHFINDFIINLEEFYNGEGIEHLKQTTYFYENNIIYEGNSNENDFIHPKLEIIDHYEIDNYSLGIPKTFYLRVLQRKWKKYYKQKMLFYKNIKNIRIRETTGSFPYFKFHK